MTGHYAVVADAGNGVFVVDVANPAKLRVVGHRQLPVVQGWIATSSSRQPSAKTAAADPAQADVSPVGGIAVGDGYIYAAGVWSDLHVIQATGLAQREPEEPGRPVAITPATRYPVDPRCTVYDAGAQVYAVAPVGDGTALVAAGASGVQLVSLRPEPKRLAQIATEGFAMDVKTLGDHVYVAEGMGGLSIWSRRGGVFTPIGRYRIAGQSIKQAVVPPPGRYALVQVGANRLQIVDLADPAQPTCVLEDTHVSLLYGVPILEGVAEGRYACCRWFIEGLFWYDLSKDPPQYSGDHFPQSELASKGSESAAMLDKKGPGMGSMLDTDDGGSHPRRSSSGIVSWEIRTRGPPGAASAERPARPRNWRTSPRQTERRRPDALRVEPLHRPGFRPGYHLRRTASPPGPFGSSRTSRPRGSRRRPGPRAGRLPRLGVVARCTTRLKASPGGQNKSPSPSGRGLG